MAVTIANCLIGTNAPPFIIAEMSGNHNQSLDRALAIVDAAAEAGAHALKLQTYTADTMTIDSDEGEFHISDPSSLWKGTSLYKLYQEAYTPWEWHKPIFDRCRERGLICFSTPSTKPPSTSSKRSKFRATRSPPSRILICYSSERLPPLANP